MPITEVVKNLAKMMDEDLAQRVKTLERFGVVGFEKPHQIEQSRKFLSDNGVEYYTNNRFLIWLPELPESLKNLFSK